MHTNVQNNQLVMLHKTEIPKNILAQLQRRLKRLAALLYLVFQVVFRAPLGFFEQLYKPLPSKERALDSYNRPGGFRGK